MASAAEDFDWYSEEIATFGDRIAGGREALGLTQNELAHRLGVKLKTIRAWEEDLSEPRANKLQILAGILNVSIRWLLTGEGEELSAPDQDPVLQDGVAELLVELRDVKAQLDLAANRVGVVEKRLRQAMNGDGP